MFALRLGSYWMLLTVAGISSLSRLKSMMRYFLRLPPPMWRTVILPWLLRPPLFLVSSMSERSGFTSVISSYACTVMKRRAADVGLYLLIAIFCSPPMLCYDSELKYSMGLLSSVS